jgi:hypothetical protein
MSSDAQLACLSNKVKGRTMDQFKKKKNPFFYPLILEKLLGTSVKVT